MGTRKRATPGALTEQIVFRVSKATRARVEKRQRELEHRNIADTLRHLLKEAGLSSSTTK